MVDIGYSPNKQYNPFEIDRTGPYEPYETTADSRSPSYAPGYWQPHTHGYSACAPCEARKMRYAAVLGVSYKVLILLGVVSALGLLIYFRKKKGKGDK